MFATASGAKTLTALAVMSLVERERSISAPPLVRARDDLPLIAHDVTIEHLLAHRPG
jgi:CubicO group peptidase (beta-lactamase class C family)